MYPYSRIRLDQGCLAMYPYPSPQINVEFKVRETLGNVPPEKIKVRFRIRATLDDVPLAPRIRLDQGYLVIYPSNPREK